MSLTLIDVIEHTGLDAMSAGVCAAGQQKPWHIKLSPNMRTGGIRISFVNTNQYLAFFEALTRQQGEFYKDLWHGAEYAATKYWWF